MPKLNMNSISRLFNKIKETHFVKAYRPEDGGDQGISLRKLEDISVFLINCENNFDVNITIP